MEGNAFSKRRLCPHCNEYLTLPVFKKHKDLYYNVKTKTWTARTNDGTTERIEKLDRNDDMIISDIFCCNDDDAINPVTAAQGAFDGDEVDINDTCETSNWLENDSSIQSSGESECESDSEVEEYWDTDVDELCEDFNVNTPITDNAPGDSYSILKTILLFVELWALFYNISAAAMNHLFQFLNYMLKIIVETSTPLPTLASIFPTSIYKVRKYLAFKDLFEKYVVCKKCNSIYHFKDCFESNAKAKSCSHVPYRNHPWVSQRTSCGHNLLKEVITQNAKEKKFYPYKTYCYYPLYKSLPHILQRKGYINLCESWRNRTVPAGVLSDVYDGSIWKEFLNYKGRPFLSHPHNLALMLNCDWFQPYKHTQYSVGVLYLTILNLPRSVRFRPENILIAGIIPGPREPKQYGMNSYLRPLVKELNALWSDGILIKCGSETVKMHAALIATVCDIPATSKLGGFLGHNSKHACWKCCKDFPFDEHLRRVDFSGAEIGLPRTHENHKLNAIDTTSAATPTQREALEYDKGSRFTELMHLTYYDCVRFAIIDPMHNLFLGTAKRIMDTWIKSEIISKSDLERIQEKVDKCVTTSEVGLIPYKISSNFARLTANEWKNWTLIFSLISLYEVIPQEHLACWELFVSACAIFSSPILNEDEILRAQDLMRQFFTTAESLFGSKFLTLNTHLHLHLHDVLRAYGPCYGYWLFSFERYNGMLGKYPTNQRSIEIQLMRHFIHNMQIRSLINNDSDLSSDSLFIKLLGPKSTGASSETIFEQDIYSSSNISACLSLPEIDVTPCLGYLDQSFIKLLPPFSLYKFSNEELAYLGTCYVTFLPDIDPLEIPQLCRKYKNIQWWSEWLNSCKLHKGKKLSTCIQAFWAGSNGHIDTTCRCLNAGQVEYFFCQNND